MAKRLFLKDDRLRPIFRVLLYLVLVEIGVVLLAMLIAEARKVLFGQPIPSSDDQITSLYFTLSAPVVTVGGAFLLRTYLDRRSIGSLGLSLRGHWWLLLVLGLASGILLQIPRLVWVMHLGNTFASGTILGDDTLVAGYGVTSITGNLMIAVLVTLSTNMALRGYVFQNVWEEWGVVAAVAASTILNLLLVEGFQILAAPVSLTLTVVAFSIVLAMSVVWTGSLWFALGFDFAWSTMLNPSQLEPYAALNLLTLGTGLVVLYVAHRRRVFGHDISLKRYAHREPD